MSEDDFFDLNELFDYNKIKSIALQLEEEDEDQEHPNECECDFCCLWRDIYMGKI